MRVVAVKAPGGLDNLAIIDKEDPKPGPGEILVRWHATSLNFHDYLVAVGGIKVPDGRIPMSDGAGEVLEIGKDVTEWKPGDKVMSMFFPNWIDGKATFQKTIGILGETLDGCIAEKGVISQFGVTAMPEGFSYAEAATLPCAGTTAWHGLMKGSLKAGDKVLIEGTGGVSVLALQFAKLAGARVFATTSSPEKAERLKEMGAEVVVNYKEDERWGKTIFKLSKGGVDHVIDVGGGSTMKQSIEAAALNGHITSIGILSGGRKGEITFPKLFFKHLTMSGLAVGSRIMQQEMIAAINNSDMRPVIDRSFGFEELADAFRHQESGAHFGKIVLEY